MSIILDHNNRQLRKEPDANIHPKPVSVTDVRAIRTGTLFYNLIRYTCEEIGLDDMKHQLEEVKERTKSVTYPPQYEQICAAYEDICERRYIIANEINRRYDTIDTSRAAAAGIDITPLPPEITPATTAEPSDG